MQDLQTRRRRRRLLQPVRREDYGHLLDLRTQLLGVAAQGAGLLHRQMSGASSPYDLQIAQSAAPVAAAAR